MTHPTSHDPQDWVGRFVEIDDDIRTQPAAFMQATLDRESTLANGQPVPPLWHWLYFLEAKRASELGRDAHPRKGGFLPPVELPRRMWAGGRFEFHEPLLFGQQAKKKSTIKAVKEKTGRSGKLCFVTVLHEVFQNGTLRITEEHDIVYREDPAPNAPRPKPSFAPDEAEVSERITPTQVMMFRYSALTFNGHRIHYDVDYARQVEGYDGLVFHGPLIATLLVDLAARSFDQSPKRFSFMGKAPIAGLKSFEILGTRREQSMELWAKRSDGVLAMSALAEF